MGKIEVFFIFQLNLFNMTNSQKRGLTILSFCIVATLFATIQVRFLKLGEHTPSKYTIQYGYDYIVSLDSAGLPDSIQFISYKEVDTTGYINQLCFDLSQEIQLSNTKYYSGRILWKDEVVFHQRKALVYEGNKFWDSIINVHDVKIDRFKTSYSFRGLRFVRVDNLWFSFLKKENYKVTIRLENDYISHFKLKATRRQLKKLLSTWENDPTVNSFVLSKGGQIVYTFRK